MIDLHVHILPGLDDGPREMQEAVSMCRMAAADGVTTVVAAPHMFNGLYEVERETILAAVGRLAQRISTEAIPLTLLPGADVCLDAGLIERFRQGRVMTIADAGKYLLVELSRDVIPRGVEGILFSLQLAGICPVISHPERNAAVQEDPARVIPFARSGNLLQVTAGSLTGDFGATAEHCAKVLLERGLVHLVASDAHSPARRPPGLSRAREVVEQLRGRREAEEIFEERPADIVAGRTVTVPETVEKACEVGWRRIWPGGGQRAAIRES